MNYRNWRSLWALVVFAFLAAGQVVAAPKTDKSDMNGDGVVDALDLEIFSNLYLEQDYQTVDWCAFYEESISNPKYFRSITSDRVEHYTALFDYIVAAYACDTVEPEVADKSDLNGDGVVDIADLALFSADYLGMDWETVDWCLFYEATLAGEDFEGQKTDYYLAHFQDLLSFINLYYGCDAPPPPPSSILLENAPRAPYRLAMANAVGDILVSDPRVGSIFIYGADLVPKAEIKGLDHPLGVAVDSQGLVLVGNDGRKNIEVYDPADGDLVTVFGGDIVHMPNAITVGDIGNIYVTDSRRHVVWKFSSSYQLLGWIGNPGEGLEDLNFPIDAEVNLATQELFVADQKNNRVQVYDLQGKWLRAINWAGSGCSYWSGKCTVPGFVSLQGLDIDYDGRLHVLDSFGGAVIVFDPITGDQLTAYGSFGTGPGQLRLPSDVLNTQPGTAIVTVGDGDRIETFNVQ